MYNKKINLIGLDIWNNNSAMTGKSNVSYNLGKLRNTVGSITRIHKHCSKNSSDPLNCTLGNSIKKYNLDKKRILQEKKLHKELTL